MAIGIFLLGPFLSFFLFWSERQHRFFVALPTSALCLTTTTTYLPYIGVAQVMTLTTVHFQWTHAASGIQSGWGSNGRL
jgi:hypothetical protein